MTEIDKILPKKQEKQQAFILDHGKIEEGKLKYADDQTSYGWNIKRYNRLKEGAFVLNRHPSKLSKDKKFEIYAGGYVEQISKPDKDGNVRALITHSFNIEPPIKQGDDFIESFKWSSKKKKSNNWANFWNQYGMNEIKIDEFEKLVNAVQCVPAESIASEDEKISEEEIKTFVEKGFTVSYEEDNTTHSKRKKTTKFIAKQIDFESIQKQRQKIGALGEAIVFELLIKNAQKNNNKLPIHVSKVEGDGLGYDIRCWNELGEECYIEVKTSTSKFSDGFEMSRNEIKASTSKNANYFIYRVYDLNIKTRECKIKIFEGPVSSETFNLEATSYKVYQK